MFNDVSDLTEKILCTIAEPVILFDENIRVRWINPAAEMLFEHSTEFMTGKNCSFLFPPIAKCTDSCPIRKSKKSNQIEYLISEGINEPERLIESIPFRKDKKKFILAIIHNIPDIDKNRALKRDFAAELNKYKTLEEAIPVISTSIFALTSISKIGLYKKNEKLFEVCSDDILPHSIPFEISRDIIIDKPLYLSAENQSFVSDMNFPSELALIPIINSNNQIKALLLAGSKFFTSNIRNKLEMVASVLGNCIDRFL